MRPAPYPTADVRAVPAPAPVRQAFRILHVGFAMLPILAGIDKFTHLLVNWDQYLAPTIVRLLPVDGHAFMSIVGIIEIIAGVFVAIAPRFGGYVVAAWLWGIIANLLLIPGYFDIALRDFVLSLGALALSRLAAGMYAFETRQISLRYGRVPARRAVFEPSHPV